MIKMIMGVYGFMDKDGIIRPKTAVDPPFELLPAQEERLVRLGVAQYVENVKSAEIPPVTQAETYAEQDSIDIDVTPDVEHALSELSVKELREIGKDYGLTFKIGTSKADMVAAIEKAEAELIAEEDDSEPAPSFDASEAVQ